MLLELTIAQLDIGDVSSKRAEDMGHLGYIQWLGALKGDACYRTEAMRAYDMAKPCAHISPAIAVFCELLAQTLDHPLKPLALKYPKRQRRGGAKARREQE